MKQIIAAIALLLCIHSYSQTAKPILPDTSFYDEETNSSKYSLFYDTLHIKILRIDTIKAYPKNHPKGKIIILDTSFETVTVIDIIKGLKINAEKRVVKSSIYINYIDMDLLQILLHSAQRANKEIIFTNMPELNNKRRGSTAGVPINMPPEKFLKSIIESAGYKYQIIGPNIFIDARSINSEW